MTDIRIEWRSDRSDCECCGSSYAEGARVYFDGKLELDLEPVATCFGGRSYTEEQVFGLILAKLGHNLAETSYD